MSTWFFSIKTAHLPTFEKWDTLFFAFQSCSKLKNLSFEKILIWSDRYKKNNSYRPNFFAKICTPEIVCESLD